MPRKGRLWFPTANPGAFDRWRSQREFLDAVGTEVPEVLEKLWAEILPHWKAIDPASAAVIDISDSALLKRTGNGRRRAEWLPAVDPDDPRFVQLEPGLKKPYSSLREWSKGWGLDFEWVQRTALATILEWTNWAPDERPPRLWWVVPALMFDGFPTLGGGPKVVKADHFRWLALYQCLGWRQSEIVIYEKELLDAKNQVRLRLAEAPDGSAERWREARELTLEAVPGRTATATAVDNGIRSAARKVGLTLRSGVRGPPRSSRRRECRSRARASATIELLVGGLTDSD